MLPKNSRRELDLQLHFPAYAFDDAEDLVLGKQHVLLVLLREHGHQIGDAHRTVGGLEGRHQDVRAVLVATGRTKRPDRADPEVASHGGVENRREHRTAVEAWPAQPIDRAAA